MGKVKSFTRSSEFYREFKETNPYLVMGLIIITLGFYIINWIYLRNKDFVLLDKFAPAKLLLLIFVRSTSKKLA